MSFNIFSWLIQSWKFEFWTPIELESSKTSFNLRTQRYRENPCSGTFLDTFLLEIPKLVARFSSLLGVGKICSHQKFLSLVTRIRLISFTRKKGRFSSLFIERGINFFSLISVAVSRNIDYRKTQKSNHFAIFKPPQEVLLFGDAMKVSNVREY